MFNGIDFSSDTATKPSQSMLEAMMIAEVGDEQKGEDPTTKSLESLISERCGFDDAIFLPSATMANQIAIRCLTIPGDRIIAAANSHILQSESGGPAIHANVMCNPIFTTTGIFTPEDIKQQLQEFNSIKSSKATLLSVENTSNLSGGNIWNSNSLTEIIQYADKLNLKKHLDGSRIFNASVKSGIPVKEICENFDTVTICLSKGLGCPVGALLVFKNVYKNTIYRLKHLMGGAMRQTGFLSAAGIFALNNNIERLAEDHCNAAILADELSAISSIKVLNPLPETNIIIFKWISSALTSNEFHNHCLQKNIRFSQIGNNIFRAVTHLNISKLDIKNAINAIRLIIKNTVRVQL